MKILHLTKFYPPYRGGIETVTFNIVEGLFQQGVDVDILCSNSYRNTSIEHNRGYKIIRAASFGKLFSTSISPQLLYYFKKLVSSYDIVHVHFPDPLAAVALYFCLPRKTKLVIHWHSDIIKQKTLLSFFYPLQRWCLNRSDMILGTSSEYIKHSRDLIDYQRKCRVVPIGILDDISFDVELLNYLKNIYQSQKIIFSLGRLVYYKGFQYLIEAAKFLRPGYKILIGGDGELREKLQKLLLDYGVEEKVVLLGRLSDVEVKTYMKFCDVFCLPSIEKSEAFGVVQLEAFSMAKPIIATNIVGSGVSWVNKHEMTGYNVPIKDSKSIALSITKIIENQVEYERMANNALSRFKKHFTAERMVKQVLNCYRELENSTV